MKEIKVEKKQNEENVKCEMEERERQTERQTDRERQRVKGR